MGFLSNDPFDEVQTQLLSFVFCTVLAFLLLNQIDPEYPPRNSQSLGSFRLRLCLIL